MKRSIDMSSTTKHDGPEKKMRTAYVGDPRLVQRVQQYLELHRDKKVIDPGSIAEHLQSKFPEYGRRKKLAFRKSVERAYENIRLKSIPEKDVPEEENGSDNSADFSDENPEYVSYKDTNSMNSLMRNVYTKISEQSSSQSGLGLVSRMSLSQSPSRSSEFDSSPSPLFTVDRIGNKNLRDTVKHKTPTTSPRPKNKLPQQTPKSIGLRDLCIPLDDTLTTPQAKTPAVAKGMTPQTPVVDGTDKTDAMSTKSEESLLLKQSVKKRRKLSSPEEDKKKRGPEITQSKVTFADVGGNNRMLADICKLLVHLKHPEVYQQLGVTPPRGLLLHGPPGCGKTLLAHAIAGELELPFLKMAATEIVSGVSGESEEKVRDTFQKAMMNAPCILFLDEIDAITQKRENASKDMERRIVSQLLTSMDELNANSTGHVLVIGATNRPDSLDPALRRAGRFDREIALGIPDQAARERILSVLCRDLRLAQGLDLVMLARMTPGYVGADLMALAREAAISAVNRVFQALQTERKSLKENDDVDMVPATDTTIKTSCTTIRNNTGEIGGRATPTTEANGKVHHTGTDNINVAACTSQALLNTTDPPAKLSQCDTTVPICNNQSETYVDDIASQKKDVQNTQCGGPGLDDKDRESAFLKGLQQKTKRDESVQEELDTAISWLKDQPPLNEEQLDNLWLEMSDFEVAVRLVQPSSKREGFATIPDVTWDDIGALRDIREELQMAILAPVRHPEQFIALGLTSPPGILLAGPPGCGKTLLAKAVANESGINFISVKGPELLNMYVGESERAVRQVFQRARNSAPCVIFFDELDALCPRRADGGEGGSSVRVVNQLLTEMDGLEERKQVFIMAATNRPDIIDPAVLRPGRLDKTLYVGLPSVEDRSDILRTLTKNGTKPRLADDVDLSAIGSDSRCSGYTGADLAALVREAAVTALRQFMAGTHKDGALPVVMQHHFNTAFSKIKPSVSEKERLKYEHLKCRLKP